MSIAEGLEMTRVVKRNVISAIVTQSLEGEGRVRVRRGTP